MIRILTENHHLDLLHRRQVERAKDLTSRRIYYLTVSLFLMQKAHQRLEVRLPELVRQRVFP